MDNIVARKIGRNQALKAIFIGLAIAYIIMSWLNYSYLGVQRAILWIWYFDNLHFKLLLLFAVFTIVILGYVLGQRAGIAILIKQKNWISIGVLLGFFIIWTTTILTGLISVVENIKNDDYVFYNYLFKPIYWVTLFGFIPTIVLGLWVGKSISKKSDAKKQVQKNSIPFDQD